MIASAVLRFGLGKQENIHKMSNYIQTRAYCLTIYIHFILM